MRGTTYNRLEAQYDDLENQWALGIVLILMGTMGTDTVTAKPNRTKHPFQNPDLGMEERITNLLSLMTREEKIACLSTKPDVPRLGVKGTGEGSAVPGPAAIANAVVDALGGAAELTRIPLRAEGVLAGLGRRPGQAVAATTF